MRLATQKGLKPLVQAFYCGICIRYTELRIVFKSPKIRQIELEGTECGPWAWVCGMHSAISADAFL